MTMHRLNRCLRRNASNGYKRLLRVCGLYIWHPPAILELLEARETLYRLKNTFKPTQVHIDQIFRLSTNFVSVSARINSLESVRARCCAFWLVLEWTNKYFGAPAPWSNWWLAGTSSTLRLGVEQWRQPFTGDVETPSPLWASFLVESGIKVWLPEAIFFVSASTTWM